MSSVRNCLRRDLGGRPVAQAAVWAFSIVLLTPGFDHLRGLSARLEPFAVEKPIAKAALETFDVTVLPRAPGRDEGRTGNGFADPCSYPGSSRYVTSGLAQLRT